MVDPRYRQRWMENIFPRALCSSRTTIILIRFGAQVLARSALSECSAVRGLLFPVPSRKLTVVKPEAKSREREKENCVEIGNGKFSWMWPGPPCDAVPSGTVIGRGGPVLDEASLAGQFPG